MFLAFAFAVELFPPFSHEMKLGVEISHDFNLLAGLRVEGLSNGSISCGYIFSERNVDIGLFLHCAGAFHESFDIESGNGDG